VAGGIVGNSIGARGTLVLWAVLLGVTAVYAALRLRLPPPSDRATVAAGRNDRERA
jgi:hypothetical protein